MTGSLKGSPHRSDVHKPGHGQEDRLPRGSAHDARLAAAPCNRGAFALRHFVVFVVAVFAHVQNLDDVAHLTRGQLNSIGGPVRGRGGMTTYCQQYVGILITLTKYGSCLFSLIFSLFSLIASFWPSVSCCNRLISELYILFFLIRVSRLRLNDELSSTEMRRAALSFGSFPKTQLRD